MRDTQRETYRERQKDREREIHTLKALSAKNLDNSTVFSK